MKLVYSLIFCAFVIQAVCNTLDIISDENSKRNDSPDPPSQIALREAIVPRGGPSSLHNTLHKRGHMGECMRRCLRNHHMNPIKCKVICGPISEEAENVTALVAKNFFFFGNVQKNVNAHAQ